MPCASYSVFYPFSTLHLMLFGMGFGRRGLKVFTSPVPQRTSLTLWKVLDPRGLLQEFAQRWVRRVRARRASAMRWFSSLSRLVPSRPKRRPLPPFTKSLGLPSRTT